MIKAFWSGPYFSIAGPVCVGRVRKLGTTAKGHVVALKYDRLPVEPIIARTRAIIYKTYAKYACSIAIRRECMHASYKLR